MTDFEKILQTRAEARAHYRKRPVFVHKGVEQVETRTRKVENDRVVDDIVLVEQPISKKFEGYRVSDFFIENLQAAGVDLKECTLTDNGFGNIDNLAAAAETLSNYVDVNNNSENNEE